jgi:F-type H+-transporting ATPase subunit delta
MNDTRAAIRYAKAALALAKEQKATEAVEQDMLSIVTSIEASEELRDLLVSPTVESSAKQKALKAIFNDAHPICVELFATLLRNKRIQILGAVCAAFISLSESLKDAAIAEVISAASLSDEVSSAIIEKLSKLTNKKITLNNIIDESLIGGFVLKVGDLQYNASVSHQLERLKRELTA